VSTDPDHRFDLAVQLNDLDMALEIVREGPQLGSEAKWKSVGDKALDAWKMDLAEECFTKAADLSSLLLIYTSLNDRDGMEKLAKLAGERPSSLLQLVHPNA
jgi:coatomer subunit beta'